MVHQKVISVEPLFSSHTQFEPRLEESHHVYHVNSQMYNVQCTVYCAHCTVYRVECIMYSVWQHRLEVFRQHGNINQRDEMEVTRRQPQPVPAFLRGVFGI